MAHALRGAHLASGTLEVESQLSPYLQEIIDIKVEKVNGRALTCIQCFVHWFLTTFSCFHPTYNRLYQDAEVQRIGSASECGSESDEKQHVDRPRENEHLDNVDNGGSVEQTGTTADSLPLIIKLDATRELHDYTEELDVRFELCSDLSNQTGRLTLDGHGVVVSSSDRQFGDRILLNENGKLLVKNSGAHEVRIELYYDKSSAERGVYYTVDTTKFFRSDGEDKLVYVVEEILSSLPSYLIKVEEDPEAAPLPQARAEPSTQTPDSAPENQPTPIRSVERPRLASEHAVVSQPNNPGDPRIMTFPNGSGLHDFTARKIADAPLGRDGNPFWLTLDSRKVIYYGSPMFDSMSSVFGYSEPSTIYVKDSLGHREEVEFYANSDFVHKVNLANKYIRNGTEEVYITDKTEIDDPDYLKPAK